MAVGGQAQAQAIAKAKAAAAAKPTTAKPTQSTKPAAESFKVPQTYRPAAESYKPSPSTRTPVTPVKPVTGKKVDKPEVIPPLGGGKGGEEPPVTGKTLVSRIPKYDANGDLIGWTLIYSDGSSEFESNPGYSKKEEEETKGTTNVQVLKSILLAKGLPSDLVEDSVTFLQTLIKDGIDAESAISIYLNSKDFTTKTGTTVKSPFYTKYGFYNDALTDKYSATELFNAVEGYKNVVTKYNVNAKFASQSYIQGYLKNKRSVADLDAYANQARLYAINADPTRVDTLKQLGYINSSTDLTDFYMDPNVGAEQMKQNINTAAFAIEAVRRANKLAPLDVASTKQYGAQLTAQGLSEAQVSALASQGYATVAETLEPLTKYSGIYEGAGAKGATTIQSELEAEQFKGLESERRKRLAEQNVMAFRGQSGLTSQSLSRGNISGAF
jgi:hypothetical protein